MGHSWGTFPSSWMLTLIRSRGHTSTSSSVSGEKSKKRPGVHVELTRPRHTDVAVCSEARNLTKNGFKTPDLSVGDLPLLRCLRRQAVKPLADLQQLWLATFPAQVHGTALDPLSQHPHQPEEQQRSSQRFYRPRRRHLIQPHTLRQVQQIKPLQVALDQTGVILLAFVHKTRNHPQRPQRQLTTWPPLCLQILQLATRPQAARHP